MPLAVFSVVQRGVGVQCWYRFVVVHRIGMVSDPHLAKFLAQSPLSSLESLSSFSLAVSVFDPSAFYSTFITAVLFREPAEKFAVADKARFQNFFVSFGHL